MSARQNIAGSGFAIALLLLSLFKLWLIHGEEIYLSAEAYDASWYLMAAKHWFWGAPYSHMAFIRPPAYPLWIALVHLWAIPLRTAIELLQMAGYLILIAGLRQAGLARAVSIFVYAALILHPASFQLNNLIRPDSFYAAMLALAFGGLIFTVLSARIRHALWTGLAFALLWNAREESFLLLFAPATFFGVAWMQRRSTTKSWSEAFRPFRVPMSVLLGVAAFGALAVDTANYCAFHGFAKSEISSPSFKAAYRALLRIKPEQVQRFIPVSSDALARAYQASPTFAQLRPQLEGEIGRRWQGVTLDKLGIQQGIAAGWLVWALREAAEPAGAYRTAKTADQFYRQIAAEINRACNEGRIPTRPVFFSFIDPGAIHMWREIPRSFTKIAGLFAQRYQVSRQREGGEIPISDAQRALFEDMTSRRVARSRLGTLQIVGSVSRPADPVKLVAFRNPEGKIEAATDRLSSSAAGIAKALVRENVQNEQEFTLRLELSRSRTPRGDLIVMTQSGAAFSGAAGAVLAGKALLTNALTGEMLPCRMLSKKLSIPKERAIAWENFIGKYYAPFLLVLSALAVIGAMTLFIRSRAVRWTDPLYAVLISLAAVIVSRVVFFSFLDATAWPGGVRYLFPVMTLYSAFAIVLISQAFREGRNAVAFRLFCDKHRAPPLNDAS